MPDFNIVPEIGGVDTLNPERIYSQEEQISVIGDVFGDQSRHGAIRMPNGLELYVGRRNPGKVGYSLGAKKIDDTIHPALFIGEDKVDDPECLIAEIQGLWDYDEGGDPEGFLFKAVRKVLIQGRHTMREVIREERIEYRGHPSKIISETSVRLAKLALISGAYEASEDHDFPEILMADIANTIDAFLGPSGLNDIEVGVKNGNNAYGWVDAPMESLFVDISGRMAEIVEVY